MGQCQTTFALILLSNSFYKTHSVREIWSIPITMWKENREIPTLLGFWAELVLYPE